jgi:hypothetical protein
LVCITESHTFRRYRVPFVQAQRIITNNAAPATSTNFSSDGHFSENTFCM